MAASGDKLLAVPQNLDLSICTGDSALGWRAVNRSVQEQGAGAVFPTADRRKAQVNQRQRLDAIRP
jgi:hypothetical protein